MTAASHSHRNRSMRFGLHTALPRGADFADFAVSVEQSGYDVLTIPDHLGYPVTRERVDTALRA